ncbi:MAG TPA: hypothetical protein VF713_12145 [Thermoanaerobaculia bacterium]
MKPIAISSYLAFAALSLYAADPQAAKEDPTLQTVKHTQKVLSQQTSAASGGDSPLVRAAKAASHPGKKSSSPLITNETLVHEGGHFTTTSSQPPLPAGNRSAGPSLDQMETATRRAKAEAAASAEQTRKLEEQKTYAAGRAAMRAQGDTPEGLYDDSPGGGSGSRTIQTVKPETLPTAPAKPPE